MNQINGRVYVKSHVGTQFSSSSTFKGVVLLVYMYPKAFLEAPEGLPTPTLTQWMVIIPDSFSNLPHNCDKFC